MTSRNLTEVFVIMRNNASKNRNHYDDRVSSICCPYGGNKNNKKIETIYDSICKHI